MTRYRIRAYGFFLLTTFLWGAASPVIKYTLAGIEPLPFLTYRFFLASIPALIYLLFFAKRMPKLKLLLPIVVYSILSTTIALGFLFVGLSQTSVLNLSLIVLSGPLLLTLAGYYFFKDRITSREKLGTAIAFFGSFLTIFGPVIQNGGLGPVTGNLFVVLYLIADVSSIVILKKLLKKKVEPLFLSNFSFLVGFLTLLPFSLLSYSWDGLLSSISNLSLNYHLGVFYMAFLSGTLAYFLRAKAQRSIEISEASVFGYLVSVFAAPIAVLWLKENITASFMVGAAIITLGVFIAEYKGS